MYVSQANYIQVCVVNMGSGIPFISALELRVLNNSLYGIGTGFLRYFWRTNMGTSSRFSTRYPLDVYDRIWWSEVDYPPLFPSAGASAASLSNNSDAYKVPGEVLRTAATVTNGNSSFSHSWTPRKPYVPPGNWILYFHFAEIQSLPRGQQREFTVSINGNQFTESVTLEYLKPVTVVSTPVTGSQINILISPTSNKSTYPPILNAIEGYNIVELLNVQTAEDDVKAINDTKATYRVNKESWQGDPCVPSNYTWDGLNCSYGKTPRIISLNLSSSNLVGNIASSFSDLPELESLDLSNNQLSGEIPETLAKLPKLRNLYLSGNNLTGLVPKALKGRVEDKTLYLSLDGNPNLCRADPCPQKKNEKSISVPVATSVSAFFVVLLCALATICLIKRKNVRESKIRRSQSLKYGDISKITKDFGTVIGKGASGKVYLGELEDRKVAVKVLSKSSGTESTGQPDKRFLVEAQLLTTVHHGNLVSLKGYCDDPKNKALIYEFMAKGNLRQHLSGEDLGVTGTKPKVLTWDRRLRIAVDVAEGLVYLHNHCNPPIIHRDIKTTNILLNENMQAKISDFGLSRPLPEAGRTPESSTPWGTAGYLPPEYGPTYDLNQKSDVYSFGIVLLELMTGHPALTPEQESISKWAIPFFQKENMQGLMDRQLQGKFDIDSAKKVAKVAKSCTQTEPGARPDINQVLTELKGAIELASKHKYADGNREIGATSLEVKLDGAPVAG
ncbi:hypothetical protein BT93_D0273 [Corymbia citriodora subsp. variegata]|nr:hypothetical protein BT93_D0273 [Corymbia citriodora subsp. variegata]